MTGGAAVPRGARPTALRPPANLAPAARRHWRELAKVLAERRVMTAGDRQVLALCCAALAAHDEAQAVLDEKGSVYEAVTASGTVLYRPRPEARLAAAAWSRALQGLVQLGLTPRARVPVEAVR
jgi:P27 family predicted phage terminase small subunit